MRIVQLTHPKIGRRVAVVDEPNLHLLTRCTSAYEIAQQAIQSHRSMCDQMEALGYAETLAYDDIYVNRSEWRLLPPIDHPEPARCFITGTGLTHQGSAENRQSMHASGEPASAQSCSDMLQPASSAQRPSLTDSMRMFELGLSGGRPAKGCIGNSPEWFYKGIGTILRAHNESLTVPAHGFDGGEEAEIAGVYVIGADGAYRLGMVQGNEFSDHVLESKNYLYLAASKLRDCSIGPELVIDPNFDDVPGRSEITRNGKTIWQATQASGEQRMCHSLANMEHHHFKNAEHRRPGDVHIHFFGADMFSFKDRLKLEDGDVMQISFDGFGRPLRNPIRIDKSEDKLVSVKTL